MNTLRLAAFEELYPYPHTAFYFSTGRDKGVESDIREECCVPTCYTLGFSLDIVILVGGRPSSRVEDDGLGFKVDSASMLEPRQ